MKFFKDHISSVRSICLVFLVSYLVITQFNNESLYAQTTTVGNFSGSPNFLGWGQGQNFPLVIEHKGTQSIRFLVNDVDQLVINPDGGVGLSSNYFSGIDPLVKVGNEGFRGVYVGAIGPDFTPNTSTGAFFSSEGIDSKEHITLQGRALDGNGIDNAGIFSEALPPGVLNTAYLCATCPNIGGFAGYFNGDLFHTGVQWGSSDLNLKQNITDLSDIHVEALLNVVPRKYRFNDPTNHQSFDEKVHYGFIAQEVNEFFPSTVYEMQTPDKYDEEGTLSSESDSHLSIDYIQYLGLLTHLYKYQDEGIANNTQLVDSLTQRLLFLKDLVLQNQQSKSNSPESKVENESEQELTVYPNPTENNKLILSFGLETDQEVVFILFSTSGQVVLSEKKYFESGFHEHILDLSQLSSGFYEVRVSCTLFNKSKKIVKK